MTGDRIPESLLEDARSRIVEVVSSYIPELKRAGKDWVACCPFHKERTPSFSVSETKGFFYCYGCGAGGDAIDFVEDMNPGISFRDAVRSILGEIKLETTQVTRRPAIKAVVCGLPGHAEDRDKAAAVMARTHLIEQHKYLMQNNTASNTPCATDSKGILMIPMINNIGETTNVAAITASGSVLYAAGNPSFGSTAVLEPDGNADGRTILCVDYAHAWRIWWDQRGKSRVLACMSPDNFRWMLLNCKDRFTHVGCDPAEADEHIEYGRAVVAVPLDPYAKVDRKPVVE